MPLCPTIDCVDCTTGFTIASDGRMLISDLASDTVRKSHMYKSLVQRLGEPRLVVLPQVSVATGRTKAGP